MIGAIDKLHASTGKPPPPANFERSGKDVSARLGRLKVLVVEDESVIGWALQSMLEDLGHDVVDVVSSGRAAVAAAAEHQPDLVIMDINLGQGLDGIEAAEQICSGTSATVIFVSAYGDDATKAKVDDRVPGALMVTKPVSPDAIRGAIARAFSHQ
ncbi:MAG TPA: response regulator [Allosphingosinicella sp.]|nr:response regulator [Allosphingosinicella sp.]